MASIDLTMTLDTIYFDQILAGKKIYEIEFMMKKDKR